MHVRASGCCCFVVDVMHYSPFAHEHGSARMQSRGGGGDDDAHVVCHCALLLLSAAAVSGQ